ncbi:selenium-binding protein 1-like protein [Dinothrombium tinctorium]|uniref:Selenium-binding protein 1-like protein n=1 Tax=Dinothrombium tinctorium TaxID=1965070 RepID=A0A3S3NY89_9ACAR|nr:selenium-binding protein 1-like protein [Dinothrombium tinctorium]
MSETCCDPHPSHCGPGYESPQQAFLCGKKETILYVLCTHADGAKKGLNDYLAVVDVDPKSPHYSQVIQRTYALYAGDEFHHSNWNVCSSCHHMAHCKRDKLIVPCLLSDRIYVFDTSNEKEPTLFKVIEKIKSYKVTAPHTTHCLATGQVLISTMGDEDGNAKGSFVLLDGNTFEIKGLWSDEITPFAYDFWYQPRHNVMVSSEWGAPNAWKKGFSPSDAENGLYGHSIHFWNWEDRTLLKSVDLGDRGYMPLETRFFHDPRRSEGFVGCALSSNVFLFGKSECVWYTQEVISVPALKVKNWLLPEMPGIITDIIISMDDRYLFFSNWVQGDVRQYDVTCPDSPKLVGRLFVGGSACKDSGVIVEDNDFVQPERPVIKGKALRGGPQMLQLSLDGKRLYVTNSLFTSWDKQFYPDMAKSGGMMVQIDVLPDNGGLKFNENFLIDFGDEPNGPSLAHEMRYPGGDCSSDIWL